MGLPSAGRRLVTIFDRDAVALRAAPLLAAFQERGDELLVHAETTSNTAAGDHWVDTVQLQHGEAQIGALLDREKPDAVLVLGDTNDTLAGARAAAERFLPLIHVDAGLRTHRSDLPDECNRVLTDHMSDLLLAPTRTAHENLLAEGVSGQTHLAGDVTADALAHTAARLPDIAPADEYVLAAIHDADAADNDARAAALVTCLHAISGTVLLSLHSRARERFRAAGVELPANVTALDAAPYRHVLALERSARAIVTDAAAVQRDAYLWGVPCVTLRDETVWDETVRTGWNVLVGVDRGGLRAALRRPTPRERPPIFGDGHAAERIAAIVANFVAAPRPRAADSPSLHAVNEMSGP
ncbi:MAG: UDP-N-acetylglucosamine 2-epimerase [Solirubrobacteraceae bacterium]